MTPEEFGEQFIAELRVIAPEEAARADQSWARWLLKNAGTIDAYPDYARLIWKVGFYSGHVYSSGDIGVSSPTTSTDEG